MSQPPIEPDPSTHPDVDNPDVQPSSDPDAGPIPPPFEPSITNPDADGLDEAP